MNAIPTQREPTPPPAEAWLRMIVDQLPAILWTTDQELRCTSLLGVGLKALGLTPNQLIGVSATEYFGPPADQPIVEAHRRALRGEVVSLATVWQGNSYQAHLEPLHNAEQAIVGVICVALDISELKVAEARLQQLNSELEQRVMARTSELETANKELKANRHFTERVTAAAPVIIYVYDLVERRNIYTNEQLPQILGYSRAEAERQGTRLFQDNFHPDDQPRIAAALNRFATAQEGEIIVTEYRLRHASGEWRWLRSRDSVFARDAAGRPIQILGVAEDITDQKQSQLLLRGEQRLLRKLLDLQNRERRLVAYELHDGFVQQVIGAQMRLAGLAGCEPPPNPAMQAELDAAWQLLHDAIAEARRLIGEMRPMVIDAQGLVPAIDDLVRDLAATSGVQVSFEQCVQFDRLSPELEGNIFRMVQEALGNVRRHSRATKARVSLVQREKELQIVVQDNGVGFDPLRVPKNHFGLESIRERARLFGGAASVESTEGEGTTIRVNMPLETPFEGAS